MLISILDEGVILKGAETGPTRTTLKGASVLLGADEVLHATQVGTTRTSLDGRCALVRSTDAGRIWSPPTLLLPETEYGDDRSGFGAWLGMTRGGLLWATVAQAHLVEKTDPRWTSDNGGWIGCRNVVAASHDRGQTWSLAPTEIHVAPPANAFQVVESCVYELNDGAYGLLFEPFFLKTLASLPHEVSLVTSTDRGATWPNKRVIARDESDRLAYFDPRLAKLHDGSWVCLFWTHDKVADESLQTTIAWSPDGYQWATPRFTSLWGFLAVPIALRDGRLLAVYNHRREPQGIRCAISDDAGQHWNMADEHVLWDQRARAVTGERVADSVARQWEGSSMTEMFTWTFGVPHGLQLADGSVLITFYATQGDDRIHQRYARIEVG